MKQEKKLRPPYASPGQVRMLLDLLGRTSPKKINSGFVVDSKITTAPNAFKVIDMAKWLEIIDKDNNINLDISNKLKLVGEEKRNFMNGLIQKSYNDLLEEVDMNVAKKEDIVNFFIRTYNFGGSQAKSASALFLSLSQEYGLTLSDELKKKNYMSSGKREVKRKKKTPSKIEKYLDEEEEIEGEVKIKITGKVSTTLKAMSKEELDDIYKNQLPAIIPALKLGLPSKKDIQPKPKEESLGNS